MIGRIAQLNDHAVKLLNIGDLVSALTQFREVVHLLYEDEMRVPGHLSSNATHSPSTRCDLDLQHFPVTYQCQHELQSACGFRLFQPLVVLLAAKDNRDDRLSDEESTIYIISCLYNIGFCYQMLACGRQRWLYQSRAKNAYESALRNLGNLHAHHDMTPLVCLLGASVSNNLAASYADTFQVEGLTRCLNYLDFFLRHVDLSFAWAYSNIFEWRLFRERHAALA